MLVQCPQCQARYRVDEKQLAGRTRARVKCTKCGSIFPVQAPGVMRTPAAPAPAPAEPTLVSKKGLGLQLPTNKVVALAVTAGPAKGKVFPLTKPRVTLGRANADILLEDPEVSRQHCALEMRGQTGLLVDLGSTNGTYVNEERIETAELRHLTEFRIGSSTLMLTVTDKI